MKRDEEVVQDVRTEHGISLLQERVAAEYAAGVSITRIATKYEIARSTIYGWFKNDRKFVAYYKALLAEVRQELRGSLSAMAADATSTLRELMDGGNEQTRLKAATYVIDKLSDDDKRVAKSKLAGYGGAKG